MSEERPERRHHDEKGGEGTLEKWRRDPISGVVFGLILAVLGVTLFLAGQGHISWDDWWKCFIIGLGVIFLIEVLIRYTRPAYRRPMFGRLVAGIILICVGVAFLVGIGTWWPLVLVAIGVAVVLYVLLGRR
jgi:hypothetical protein